MPINRTIIARLAVLMTLVPQAHAGPPYVSDDPEPTDYGHYEVYTFASATSTRGGTSGAAGIDFNYGARTDLQLTLVAPVAYERSSGDGSASGLGNIELAAKLRLAHQAGLGWDVSVFPRIFLPSASSTAGDPHGSFLLPVWVERDWGPWSTFGGGGYVFNHGADAKDYALMGWAIARQVVPKLQIGAEIFHQSAATRAGVASTGLNAGLHYDLSDHYHLLGSIGPGIQNAAATNERSWYLALLITR